MRSDQPEYSSECPAFYLFRSLSPVRTTEMRTQALVVLEPKEKFALEDIELCDLREDEVLVEMVATGICHTDLKSAGGGSIVKIPIVLGHEGTSRKRGSLFQVREL